MLPRDAGFVHGSDDCCGSARRHVFVPVPDPDLVPDSDCFASARRSSFYGAAASGVPDCAGGWVHHSFGYFLLNLLVLPGFQNAETHRGPRPLESGKMKLRLSFFAKSSFYRQRILREPAAPERAAT